MFFLVYVVWQEDMPYTLDCGMVYTGQLRYENYLGFVLS